MKKAEQKAYNAENYPASVLTWLNEITDKIYDTFEAKTCENCNRCMKKTDAYLCLFGDTREVFWIPKHIFKSGCDEWEKVK